MNNALGLFSASVQLSGERLSCKAGHPHSTMTSSTQIYDLVWPPPVLQSTAVTYAEHWPSTSGRPREGFHPKIPIHFLQTTQKVTRRYMSILGYITEVISSFSPANSLMNFFIWCQHRAWCWTIKSDPALSLYHLSPRACFRHRKGWFRPVAASMRLLRAPPVLLTTTGN